MSKKLILINGEIITVNSKDEIREALVILNNKITFVGNNLDALKYKDSKTVIIDLKGKAVTPGFIDCHIHMAVSGIEQNNSIDLSKDAGVNSISDILEIIKTALSKKKFDEWITGAGYNHEDLAEKRHPHRWELDSVSPNNPVNLSHTSGHLSVSNTNALELGHLFDGQVLYNKNDIYYNENNEVTGVLKESAHFKMMSFLPIEPSDSVIVDGIKSMSKKLIAYGITTSHDAGGFGTTTYRTLQKAKECGNLINRSYPMLWSMYGKDAQIENLHIQVKSGFYTGLGDDKLKIGPLKIMLDGSSVGGTCATRKPFGNNTDIFPLTFNEDDIDDLILEAHKANFQVTAHAIGDRAIEVLLNAFERAQEQYPRKNCRHRIEHCMICPPDLIKRIKKLRIIPIPNPGFISCWGNVYKNLYSDNINYIFPIADYIKEGIPCAFGSDALALADYRPLLGIATAMERKDLVSNDVISEKQSINLLDAIRCYTYNGAFASFDENKKGSIEVGKLADLAILSDSLLNKTPDEIRNMKVIKTILDGEIVYDSN